MKPSTPTAALAFWQAATSFRRLAVVTSGASPNTISTGPAWPLSASSARLGGMPGAQRLALHGRRMRGEGRGHVGGAGADHTDDPRGLQRRGIGQHVAPPWAGWPGDGGPSAGADFMRVPAPAARTTTAMGDFMRALPSGRGSRSSCRRTTDRPFRSQRCPAPPGSGSDR